MPQGQVLRHQRGSHNLGLNNWADIAGLNKRYRQATNSCPNLAGQTLWCCVFSVGSTTARRLWRQHLWELSVLARGMVLPLLQSPAICFLELASIQEVNVSCPSASRRTGWTLSPLPPLPAWIQLWEIPPRLTPFNANSFSFSDLPAFQHQHPRVSSHIPLHPQSSNPSSGPPR
ncbi:hypothetical protein B0T18DRAFT_46914 [Schizothecium vesticola]|uniref:Uncharacterized protein n=1 Tax=Schizothecium vesticola TaxID=314040 RepID=A0AA40FBN8_9PEZI|nr:hypothetical protein B0T18DRAFT_46914 [Schizothecium vesticola]